MTRKKINEYYEADLDKFECFNWRPEDPNIPAITFRVLDQAKMYGVLENMENFKQLAFITMTVTRFTTLLNLNHSVAINIGRLPLGIVANYSYADLVQLEIGCLFEIAEVFGTVIKYLKTANDDIVHERNMISERTLLMVHKLVDKVHMKILNLSVPII